MNENQKLQLQNMIKANNVEDNTSTIRKLRHSHKLRDDINNLILLKNKYQNDQEKIMIESMTECEFLCNNYTDLFNKIRKDEIDLDILFKAIDVLKDIEDGKLDQHEGSFEFGNLLKKIYIDSALKKADKLNSNEPVNEYKKAQVAMTWKDYKAMNKLNKKK
jgi:hypothetical protein